MKEQGPQARRTRTNQLVKVSVFIAIILIQSWVPMLGNITIPPLPFSITYIHVTVIVATLWLGVREGMMVGAAWGLNSWVRAITAPASPLNYYVLSSPLVSVLPRVLMPLIVGGLVMALKPLVKSPRILGMVAGFCGSFLNTLLVLGAIVLFRQEAYLSTRGITEAGLWQALSAIIVSNGLVEAIVASILTPTIYQITQQLDKGKQRP